MKHQLDDLMAPTTKLETVFMVKYIYSHCYQQWDLLGTFHYFGDASKFKNNRLMI